MDKEKKHCLNCNNIVEDKYCGKCGQSIDVSQISIKHVIQELQYGLLHVNKGIFYTAKELIFRPGATVKNYLDGKRVKYTKSFIFLIIIGVIYSLIFHFFHYFPMEEMNNQNSPILDYIPLYKWYSQNYSLVLLSLIPFYSLSTFWLFSKKGYNYTEHLVLFSYLTGGKISLLLIIFPLIYFTKSAHIYQAGQIVTEIYLIWGLSQFFRSTSLLRTVLKVLLSLVLALTIMMVLIFIAFIILRSLEIRL